MKNKRQEYIIDIITKKSINNQTEILNYLKMMQIHATQATVSRDIKELGIVKIVTDNGEYRYIYNQHNDEKKNITTENESHNKYEAIFKDSVIKIDYAQNIIVVKCYIGMGNAACAALEELNIINAVGMLAGDDTFLIIVNDTEEAKKYKLWLDNFLSE